ncbi:MAG: hypothetical protein JXB62_05130 [Pirellulales bacterium]|nr:hypothetical protein [Pirellulales bacterium]
MVNKHTVRVWRLVLLVAVLKASIASAEPERYRRPAPSEDRESQIELPVFGACAGLPDTDRQIRVMEWVAKRTWHVLDLPYAREDYAGPPKMRPTHQDDGWVLVEQTVTDGGVPLRNQIITAEVEQFDKPVLMTLRCTDAFGELLLEMDLARGSVRVRSVTVSRSMIGGHSHSSPMPEQSSSRVVTESTFQPIPSGVARLKVKTLGRHVTVWANGNEIVSFLDPDPAAGKFGFGSAGRMRFRNVSQWELISEYEKQRREACVREMHRFCEQLDTHYEADVDKRNVVEVTDTGLSWSWPATEATVEFRLAGPCIVATVRAGLYGNDTLVAGGFPDVEVLETDGNVYRPDAQRQASIEGDRRAIRMKLPLQAADGKTATAHVLAKLTVQTVWFWTVTVEGVEARSLRAHVGLADSFRIDAKDAKASSGAKSGAAPLPDKSILRHNARAGLYLKAIEPANTELYVREESNGELGIRTSDHKLRFATSILPSQPLNLTGFKHRMVHYIRYPEGPVQHWRRAPSNQQYPDNVDLARFAGHGAGAMVWHHTWLGNDYRDREGFFVNHDEIQRAMRQTHGLGMKAIGYLGIVPGRSSLLRYEDTCPLGGGNAYGGYAKNWDLQDHTFYHVAGRYPEFIAWMADYWCKEYGLDGFYLDGGAFGQASRGGNPRPLWPEDEGLSLDELQHRAYWRVKKVLELNDAGYGLEPWSGLNYLLNGFYDCMMIGESFQEADPAYYRDGHNALLTGCTVKMYGMRESSQNPYNIAMAAVNLSDIQVCSGNGAWGDVADTTDTWKRVRPLWDALDSIDWNRLIDARPWYAQQLVSGRGFYASNYTTPHRVVVFLANKTEEAGLCDVTIDPARLPEIDGAWRWRFCLGRTGPTGDLGDGKLKVRLPALHDGPIGIELVADQVAASAPPDDGFRPSTADKKLLCFRGPVVGDDAIHFDGVITGGPMIFWKKLDPEKQKAWAEETAALDFGRHTDNFYLCYCYPGKTTVDFDWFDDMDWIVENWRIMAASAKTAGFKGICFDTEYYEGLPPFCYEKMRHHDTRSYEAYRRQVFQRGEEIMRAVNKEFPDIKILLLLGYSGSYCGVPQHPLSRKKIYSLVSAFVDGLLSQCGPEAEVHDMHEQAFSNRVPGSYARQRAMMTDLMPARSFDPDRYRSHHRAGFSFWADCWENASQGRPFDTKRLDNNYYTPEEFAYSLHHALAYSDRYVWMWPGAMRWWDRTAKTLGNNGDEVQRPLPQGYIDALRIAHQPSVSKPAPGRKPNTYRNLPAATQEGFDDSATFDDLWTRCEFVENLPVPWRFHTDPDEIGVASGWQAVGFDDRDWPTIRIREFWENQGYSPYDGAAWYRLDYTAPELPDGKKVYLAFGAVSDEASVYVNGKLRYASRYGDNTRHKRFLVDVTGLVESRRKCTIAVRVWNVNWCGGIWKGVKLIAGVAAADRQRADAAAHGPSEVPQHSSGQ